MTLEEIKEIFAKDGITTTFGFWPKDAVPPMPYKVWTTPENNNFMADNEAYVKIVHIRLELYTAKKGWALEEIVEKNLDAAGLAWEKDQIRLPDENCYITGYEMEVLV